MEVIHRGKDMRANGLIGITDRHGDVEDRLKGLARVEPLCFSADEDRYRCRFARSAAASTAAFFSASAASAS